MGLYLKDHTILHVIVLYQNQPLRLHKSHTFFSEIASAIRYGVGLHFVHIQRTLQEGVENV